jgi:electron transfer flavoprotein beta subunit
VLECSLPSVITTDLRLNEPRYATLPNIMKAKSKPFQVESLKSLELTEIVNEISSRFKIKSIREPEKRKGGVTVANVDELIDKLRNEASVL